MIKQISDLYDEALQAGRKVTQILISYIGYDHLKSELRNRKDEPVWIDRVKVAENIRGVRIVDESGSLYPG